VTDGAGVLVIRTGRVLAISRGHDRHDLGFPGGHKDTGDPSHRYTAARELWEETGIVVHPGRLRFIMMEQTRSGGIYALFEPTSIVSWPRTLRSKPFEGYVGWHRPEELCSPHARHGEFQCRVLRKVVS